MVFELARAVSAARTPLGRPPATFPQPRTTAVPEAETISMLFTTS